MNLQNPTLKKAMIEALEKSLGIVTTAAKIAGIDRSTHYVWLRDDEDYKKAVEDLEDVTLDFAESQLHKQIKNGNTSATIFYMKTKGKKRGYIEQSIMGVNLTTGINVTVDSQEASDDLDDYLNDRAE